MASSVSAAPPTQILSTSCTMPCSKTTSLAMNKMNIIITSFKTFNKAHNSLATTVSRGTVVGTVVGKVAPGGILVAKLGTISMKVEDNDSLSLNSYLGVRGSSQYMLDFPILWIV